MGILKEIDIETRPCRYGLTSFFRNDTIVSRSLKEYGEWAQAEIDFLLALVGSRDTVLDIGAFIGTHTLAFAKRVHGGGEVYAFEPQPVFFEVLKKNVDQNGMANVKLFNVAVSEEVSRLEISEADVRQTRNFAGTSLLDAVHSATDDSRQYVIDVMTVDQLAIDRCDLIKIDAENMEINILRGAQQTLRATRPVVFAECHSLRYGWPLAEFMKGERYRVYLLNVPAYNNDNFRRNVDNFLFDGHEAALIFIPEERLSGILDQLDQLQRLPSLIPSTTPDDLALGLLKKPQYKYEVMSKCDAAGVLGIEFWANETEVEQFRSELKTLQATAERMREEMGVLEELKIRALSLTSERDRLAEEKAELQATAERMREEMGVLEELKIRALSLTSERNRLAEEKAELQATIRSQHEALAQREEEVKRSATERRKLADDLAQIQAAHGNLDREVTALRATLQQQQETIISKDATLSHIYNSHGWKTLLAYYEIRNKLLPEGTWQRAFARRLFHSGLSLKRRFSQQGQLAAVAPLPQKEHEAAVTGEIVQSTGQVVQELMTRSARGEESSGEDYETLSGQIATLRQARLERLVLKRPQMVCVDETKLSTHAKSLVFMANDPVQVSIVIPVYNNLKFTLECLTSLMEHSSGIAYEVIVVDDGSSDQTPEILSLVPNITYIRNEENLGFIHTCNRGAEIARGQYIIFLNNDAQVTENWLQPLIQTFGDYDNVGAVGPKILFPDGRLQEAGALINPDAASKLIGLFDDPDLPRYNYAREVMYCSGACLLVNARKFRELGGFDVSLAPAYCEDWDLAFRLREQGLRVIYNPNSVLIHHLSVTANRIDESFKMSCVVRNQQKLSPKMASQNRQS